MLTVAKKVIKFTNKLLLIIQTIDCNTETNDDFCVDENKDDLYIFFKKHCVIASNNASFFTSSLRRRSGSYVFFNFLALSL